MFESLEIIILAAGKGARMHSHLPKVLHRIGGKTLIQHVIQEAESLNPKQIHIVYGFGGDSVREATPGPYNWVRQEDLLGTGHAVMQALPFCSRDSKILILVSDIPLIRSETLKNLLNQTTDDGVGVLTAVVENPEGLGRIIRNEEGQITGIVEEKDTTFEEKLIREVNTGVIVASCQDLERLLKKVQNHNAQKEYYLTDVIGLAANEGIVIEGYCSQDSLECGGINNKIQLALAERYYQKRLIDGYMRDGLIVADPARVDVRGNLIFGENTFLDINVVVEGNVFLGNDVVVGAGCVLKDCTIKDGSVLSPYTVIEGSVIGENATLGPFARFRPGCELMENVHVGNFVEVKKSKLGKGTKSGHLSYLGDSDIGDNVNIGAGTITCNYDGANKWKTKIGNDVFVGSDTQLVAPVTVGDGVTIGAGTTVTKNIPEKQLVITRAPLKMISGWKRPEKGNKKN